VGRTFLLGGDATSTGVLDFGSGAFSLLRGFPIDTFAGSRVALLNADYRWPIARPQRGLGTWPFFVHTIHAAVFADAGDAWTHAFSARAIKTSTGAEVSADVIAGYFLPLTATIGAAWGHDGSGAVAGGATVYVRVGKAF
jgi:hemolysin activation/secretion protein